MKLVKDLVLVRKCINNNKIESLNSWNEMKFVIYELLLGGKVKHFFQKSTSWFMLEFFTHVQNNDL